NVAPHTLDGTLRLLAGSTGLVDGVALNGLGSVSNFGALKLTGATIGVSLANSGTLTLTDHANNSINGSFANRGTLRITADGTGSTTATFAQGFTNTGEIDLTSSAANAAALTVSTGDLTNQGTIAVQAGAGGSRTVTLAGGGTLANQGTLTAAQDLNLSAGGL